MSKIFLQARVSLYLIIVDFFQLFLRQRVLKACVYHDPKRLEKFEVTVRNYALFEVFVFK